MTNIDIKPALRRVVFIAVVVVLAVVHWYIGRWGLADMISLRAEEPQIADVAVDWAPGDPQTHFAAAVLYDRTLLAADQQRSLAEYEKAAALSPHNYILWLEYGKALERSGDRPKAETALKRALELAPNYAAVQWALGNLLVRNGETDAGFERIRKAVDGDPQYAGAAASFAYQYFDGDLAATRRVAGTSDRANAALALLLAKEKRFEEAITVWQNVREPADGSVITAAKSLVAELISAGKYGAALRMGNSLDASSTFAPETVTNGGFENAVKLDGASPFEWQIGPGDQPQVLESTAQPHGGSRSLVLRFSSDTASGLRGISQTIVIRPGTKYMVSGFYHSDLKSDGKVVWQVADASGTNVLAEAALGSDPGWSPFSTTFQAPAGSDAVVLRAMLKGCSSALCPMNGSVWLDDIELKAIDK